MHYLAFLVLIAHSILIRMADIIRINIHLAIALNYGLIILHQLHNIHSLHHLMHDICTLSMDSRANKWSQITNKLFCNLHNDIIIFLRIAKENFKSFYSQKIIGRSILNIQKKPIN
jgi:hypothetical protein